MSDHRKDSTKSARVPELPPYYPNDLKPQTRLILIEAVRKFPDQGQTLEMCKYIFSALTPHVRAEVERGTLRAEGAQSGMEHLLYSVLVSNAGGSSLGGLSDEAFRIRGKIEKSDEWLALGRAIVEAETKKGAGQTPDPVRRNMRIDAATAAWRLNGFATVTVPEGERPEWAKPAYSPEPPTGLPAKQKPPSEKADTMRKGRGGRPRKDDERNRVCKLRSEGKSWGKIHNILNHELNQNKSKDAYRALATPKSGTKKTL